MKSSGMCRCMPFSPDGETVVKTDGVIDRETATYRSVGTASRIVRRRERPSGRRSYCKHRQVPLTVYRKANALSDVLREKKTSLSAGANGVRKQLRFREPCIFSTVLLHH